MAATLLTNLGAGTAKATALVEQGDRAILLVEDLRPQVIMPSPTGAFAVYNAGIKAPTAAPVCEVTGTSATYSSKFVTWDIKFIYAFRSSHRNVISQPSPPVTVAHPNLAYRLTVKTFEDPRDGASQTIDEIIIGAMYVDEWGNSPTGGYRCFLPVMKIDCSDGVFTSKTFTFDLSAEQVARGFDMLAAGRYCGIPPAFKFGAAHGERIWYGGMADTVNFDGVATATLANVSYRGKTRARVTLSGGTSRWTDGYHWRALMIGGLFAGFIEDVYSTTVAYLDRSIPPGVSSSSTAIVLRGTNDRVWSSSYFNDTNGSIGLSLAECVRIDDYQSCRSMNDEIHYVRGLNATNQGVAVVQDNGVFLLSGGANPNTPKIEMSPMVYANGCVSDRGTCVTANDESAWIGNDGVHILTGQSAPALAEEMECRRMFDGEEWIAASNLTTAVLAYIHEFDGLVIGNLTVGGTANRWLLVTRSPQAGMWLMDNQKISSNILSYLDDYGRTVLLCGDDQNGRIKRLLSPSANLLDTPTTDGTAAAYTCLWRGGWSADKNAKRRALSGFRPMGILAPGSTFSLALSVWRENKPLRKDSDLTSGNETTSTVTQNTMFKDTALGVGTFRFYSLGISFDSTSGKSSDNRPMEMTQWEAIYAE